MNYPILAAGCFTFLAFLAHTFVGTRQAMRIAPNRSESETFHRYWVQSMGAWHMVTVDLLALSVLLVALGTTDYIQPKRPIALALSLFYTLWGAAWLIQLAVLRRRGKDYLLLSQWLFCLICAGLLCWGAKSW